MRTLENHLILFDAECPMCKLYTKAFVDTGLLDKDGRAAYQEIDAQTCPTLDRQRAANEIALVNQTTGEVTYGIESLFKLFGVALPLLKPVFEFRPLVWLMSKVYASISYNRRVIIPAETNADSFQFQPTFKLRYRVAYLILTLFITAYIVSAYAKLMNGLLPEDHVYREYLICGGQLVFQGIVITILNKAKRWDYLGNMMTISFSGALLLCPIILLARWVHLFPIVYAAAFLAVAGLMLLEHIRRTKLLGLGWILSFTWVAYRLAVLIFILLV